MKPFKAVAALASAAALAVVTACGSATDVSNNAAGPDTQSSACKSTAGITDGSIKLGVLSDLSGPVAAGGIPFYKGLQAYIDYANENLNGLNGRKIELVVQDHQYDPEKALTQYRAMKDQVAAIPMAFGTAITAALSPLAVKDCMSMISNAGAASEQRPNVFFAGPTVEDQVINVLDWYVNAENHPGAKVAIFAQTGPGGDGMIRAAEAAAGEFGFQVVAKQSYSATDKSFQGQLTAIKAANPDVVLMGNQPSSAIGFVGEAEAAGAKWDYVGTQGVYTPSVFGLPVADAFKQKVRVSYGAPVFAAGTEEIDLASKELAKRAPLNATDPSSLVGWEAGAMIYQALANAGKGELTRGAIYNALSTLSMPGIGTPKISFDPRGATPGVPFHDTAITQPDPATIGGLKIVRPYSASAFLTKYHAQSK